MNKDWSTLNKTMQAQIKKKDTYEEGIDTFIRLRSELMQTILAFRTKPIRADFSKKLNIEELYEYIKAVSFTKRGKSR